MAVPDLDLRSRLPAERLTVRAGPAGEIAVAVSDDLVERGFTAVPVELDRLHEVVDPASQHLDDNQLNEVSKSFYRLSDRLFAGYLDVVRALSHHLPWDFLFQTAPVVRFHFPVPYPDRFRGPSGRGSYFHTDLLGGHPVEMVNVWLALTPTKGTNALHLATLGDSRATLDGFLDTGAQFVLSEFVDLTRESAEHERRLLEACHPVELSPGELILFDPRCIHGGAENREDATRVSLDFRIVPLPDEGRAGFEADLAARHPSWRRGEILHRSSAGHLAPRP